MNPDHPEAMRPDAPDSTLPSAGATHSLRRRAEDRYQLKLALPLEMLQEMPPQDAQLLYHELRVHQIEMELQNEELRRVQVELEAARERYFDLYDMAPVGYCTVDDDGQILEANLTSAALLGVTRSALVKLRITHFMPMAQCRIYQQCCALLDPVGQTQTCEVQMVTGTGQPIWVSLAANMSRSADGAVLFRVMLKDVSERVRMNAVLEVKNAELERARQLADKANSAKSDFLTSMSHELRSPLHAILGFAQLLEGSNPAPTAAQKSSIDQIVHGGWYLLDLVNEILDLASIESGQIALAMAQESLTDVLADCQTMIEPQATSSQIAVNFPTFEQPWLVLADRRRLKQVVINLLSNAIKYNREQGTVKVNVSQTMPGRVRVSVHDDGLGLTPEQLKNLFQPFNRLGQELGPLEGTGIGLAVSKRLVEMMGGTIGVTSRVGVGSVFWFELALAEGNA